MVENRLRKDKQPRPEIPILLEPKVVKRGFKRGRPASLKPNVVRLRDIKPALCGDHAHQIHGAVNVWLFWVEVVLRFTLTRIRFERLMEKAGIDKALQRIGLRQQLNVFIPRLTYFLVLLSLLKRLRMLWA